jgi:hypothetical protein
MYAFLKNKKKVLDQSHADDHVGGSRRNKNEVIFFLK